MEQTPLSGRSEARGRNGHFMIASLQSGFMWPAEDRGGPSIWVEGFSKTIGDMPPLALYLTVEDARVLVDRVQECLVERRLFLEHPEYAARLRAVGTSGVRPDERPSEAAL